MGISRTGCVFTGVELCTRMMQFSGLYIVLSLLSLLCIGLSLSVTDADEAWQSHRDQRRAQNLQTGE